MGTVKRYKISKDQLERVVESFVMEAAKIESKKAPVKDHIPSQGAEAKKHVKNKMSGKMVEKGQGVPSPGKLQKKLSQAPESKKHVSKSSATHSTKAKVVKEGEIIRKQIISEGVWDKIMQWMGHQWDQEKAQKVWNDFYVKQADKLAKAYANGSVDDFKKAVMNFMKANGGIPILDGKGKNAEWDGEKKEFKRLSSKLGGPGSVSGAMGGN